ncbi:MAG TPA: methylthioribulose 1-phosphate dehydratase [Vicinamibacteria bacterium]|nr:methylthioribulose 1-phosphate dehydratase [Vicinamibacteria bacterium]
MDTWSDVVKALVTLGREAHGRGWVPGTSGNFSAVVGRDPLEVAITSSGRHKGHLDTSGILRIDGQGAVVWGAGRPSAETAIHLAIVAERGAGAVAHTHSRAATLLSGSEGSGIALEGYELLKGLAGVRTHLHREWLPLIENSQDWPAQVAPIREMLARHPEIHGFLIRRHGLYTWGKDLQEAGRHLEVLEFLLDVLVAGHPPPRAEGR